jgi:hypothetical protein
MKRLFLTLAILLLAAKSGAATRVALVSDSGDSDVAAVLDLATVQLGQEKDIELLDRAAIAQVLTEQNLSLAGAVDPNSVVRVGKLLSVDLFAVIDSVAQTQATTGKASRTVAGLVVFDAKTGARLWDATLSVDGVQTLAESVVGGVLSAQHKQIAVGLPTICLVSVRNADLPSSLDSLCNSVGLLLERRFTASPDCVVLERERLDQVNKERSLPGETEQHQQLLASLVMLELECGRGPEGKGMSASVRLTDDNGKLLNDFSVTDESANADKLAVALYQKISEAMKLKSGSAMEDRVRESDQFRREGEFFLSQGDSQHGIQDLEAALALNPENYKLRRDLAGILMGYAEGQTNLIANLRIADRAMDLFLDSARPSSAQFSLDARCNFFYGFLFRWDKYLRKLDDKTFLGANYLSAAEIEESRQLWLSIYEKYCSFHRAFLLNEQLSKIGQKIVRQPDDNQWLTIGRFRIYCELMALALWIPPDIPPSIHSYPSIHEEWSRDWLAMLKGYLKLLDQAPLEQHPRRLDVAWATLQSVVLAGGDSKWVNIADREEAWRLMAASTCPLVRALGKLDQSGGGKALAVGSTSEAYRLYLQQCVLDLTDSTNLNSRRLFYEAPSPDSLVGTDLVTFCDFMLQQKDLHPDILGRTISYLLSQTNREDAGEAVGFCDRAFILLRQPDVRFFGGDTNQYLQNLAKQREAAQKKFKNIIEPPLPALPALPALPPLPPAWCEARQLVDLAGAKSGLTQMFRPVVQGDFVYTAGYGTDEAVGGQFLQLLRISLKSGAVEPLSHIAVTNFDPVAACVDENNYYLGTGQGVFIFPKSGGMVRRIDQNDGLPSDTVTALDCLDGKLYVGLGESGYLVSYDLKQRQFDVLCSPRRREELSPFDNGLPLAINLMVADKTKRRLVLVVNQGRAGCGIWFYNPATSEFKCIFPRPSNDYLLGVRRVSDTQISIMGLQSGTALFDLKTDKPALICGLAYEELDLRCGIFFVHDNWLWIPGRVGDWSAFSRISMDSNQKENLPALRQNDKNFLPQECFQLVGSDQALIGDQRGLWLLKLPDVKPEPQKTALR